MIIVDPSSSTPPFEQIKQQVTAQRASGRLKAGDRLPPVRTLASELGLAPNTVAKAYRELEASRVIETRGRAGSFVTADPGRAASEVDRAVAAFVRSARAVGMDEEAAVTLLRRSWHD